MSLPTYSELVRTVRCLVSWKNGGGGGGGTYTAGTGLQLVGDEFSIADPTALKTLTLAQFSATTSAQLAGVLSDETGFSVGALAVFNINPNIDGPRVINGIQGSTGIKILDFATVALAVNGLQATASATGSGPTLTVQGSDTNIDLNLAGLGTGGVKYQTFEVGWKVIPQNSQSADYPLVLSDAGKHILHPSSDASARTFTIPANGSVAYPIGTALTFVNQNGAGSLSIAITTDTMRLAGSGATGTRTLAANGIATALKITATEWIISGTNLS